MPGPRVKGKRPSAVQLRAAHVRPLQSGNLLAVRSKSITSRYILYSFAEFCYNGSIPFITGHFEGVIL